MAVRPNFENSEDIEDAIRRQCNRWMHEYIAFSAWNTFREHDNIETSTRNIIWGFHQGDLLDQELVHGQVQLLALLCTLSTESALWDKWLEEEGVLPLEKSADLVRELVEEYSVLAEDNAEVARETEIQAVLECCRTRQFRMARDVLQRIWKRGRGDMTKDTYRHLVPVIENKAMKDPFVQAHTYENYLMQVKQHLGEAFASMDRPWLMTTAECCLQKLSVPTQDRPKSPKKSSEPRDSWPRKGSIPARFIKPNNLHITSQDVDDIREFVRENKDVGDVLAANSNLTVVQKEMRARLDRKDLKKQKRSASEKQTTKQQNTNNNNKNIIKELDKAIDRLDQMKQQRLDSEMAFIIKECLPSGEEPRTGANHDLLDEDDDDDDDSSGSEVSPSKRIKPLPEMPKRNVMNIRLRPPRRRRPWTEEETKRLREGVERYGEGRWAKIKRKFKFVNRTSVNLKDRWRTIMKASQQ